MIRPRDAALLAGFLGSLLVVLATPWWTRDRVADVAIWVRFMEAQRAHLVRGTVVVVHPPWRDDVERALRDAGLTPEAGTITTALAPRSTDPLPALLVVREAGGVALPALLRDSEEVARDGVLVLERPRPRLPPNGPRDLLADLAQVNVEVRLRQRTVACPWDAPAQRHTCEELPEWMYVGHETLPVGGKREACTWAHPITGGSVVLSLPAGGLAGAVVVELALTDTAADNAHGAAVTAALQVDEVEMGRVTQRGRRGFARTRVDVPRDARTLALHITTPHDGQRHTCVRLRAEAP